MQLLECMRGDSDWRRGTLPRKGLWVELSFFLVKEGHAVPIYASEAVRGVRI